MILNMNMTTSILFYLLVTTFKLLQEYNFNPNKHIHIIEDYIYLYTMYTKWTRGKFFFFKMNPQGVISSLLWEASEMYIGGTRWLVYRKSNDDLLKGSIHDIKKGFLISFRYLIDLETM